MKLSAKDWQPISSAPRDGTLILVTRRLGSQKFEKPETANVMAWRGDSWWQLVLGKWERALFEPNYWQPEFALSQQEGNDGA